MFRFLGSLFSDLIFFILHVTGSGSFPSPLGAKEERECLENMKSPNPTIRKEARNRLIEHNLRLVAHIIKKYYASVNDQDDLISIGTIGLIKAVDSFDNSKGIRLSSYAARCIENAILSQMRFQEHRYYPKEIVDDLLDDCSRFFNKNKGQWETEQKRMNIHSQEKYFKGIIKV